MKDDPFNKMGEEEAARVAYLIAGYIRHTLTEKEHDELDEWITASDENLKLFEELTDPDTIQEGLNKMSKIDVDGARERVKSRIKFTDSKAGAKRRWVPMGIAASVILLAGLVIFSMRTKKPVTKHDEAKNIIQPGGNYAMLTLADGRTVNLYEMKNGLIDSANGNEVIKTADGQISYEIGTIATKKYHTLITPVGGQYSVTLPDGSRVWLNSSSSLRYPVGFVRGERVVQLSGEGYFEVAERVKSGVEEKVPFIVESGGVSIEVLGTHFNVNSYEDEDVVRTTLLEGKVKVTVGKKPESAEGKMIVLNPGEQGRVDKSGEISVAKHVNTEEVMAWKNELFLFKDAQIETIMRQVARWYGVEVVYEAKPDHHFNATIKRGEPIEKLLGFLAETKRVRFRVEGKRVIVNR